MGRTEQFDASTVRFLSEQDGIPERELKGHLAHVFNEHGGTIRAYLAQIDYGNPDDFNVVLCLRLIDQPEAEFTSEIRRVFSDMFRSDEHLDVLILREAQEIQLSAVCRPFFDSTGN